MPGFARLDHGRSRLLPDSADAASPARPRLWPQAAGAALAGCHRYIDVIKTPQADRGLTRAAVRLLIAASAGTRSRPERSPRELTWNLDGCWGTGTRLK